MGLFCDCGKFAEGSLRGLLDTLDTMTPQPLLINMLSCKTNRYEWLHAADVKATRFCAPRMLSVNNRERARPCSVLCLVRDTS